MTQAETSVDFVRGIIADDNRSGKFDGRVITRFPPEPNGYLHIGHAKSICLNFGLAAEFGGACNLRFDDTNPSKEEVEFVRSIQEDVRWLGFDWGENLFYASDYFGQLYDYAIRLIEKGKAYVCDLTSDEVREYRGNLTKPGKDSPYRGRSIEENLDLFRRMRVGEFEEGAHTLRAKIDMASPNLNLRDPVLYRILKETHHRTGDEWPIYPMYDFAHGQSDSIEHITHSVCTLEFEDHRPLYDWFLNELDIYHSQQIEFARLNLTHTVLSKRRLIQLVDEGYVNGWDDPRLPTISGLRRRGYTPEAIRDFCDLIGVAKRDNTLSIALLEHALRDDLNKRSPRVMGVLDPLKVVIENYPEGKSETIVSVNNPEDMSMGERNIPFSRTVYIEKDDFREEPPPKFYRLSPGREVRLKDAYYITCTGVAKDETTGEVIELRCTYDPETYGGTSSDGRKVRGTSHWVSADHAVDAEVRIYDHLFSTEDPDDVPDGGTFIDNLNPESLVVLKSCKLEQGLDQAKPGERFQFLRQGYFCVDPDSTPEAPVFNRTVALRDTWSRMDQARKKG
ncbi:MAG: glutamine--tRNA ligase [Chloroflexi bacterium]|jgi:glutaminyl-tRNA synthetase|nr:glutamine--tRNA ligase/YqeY domain fusion protein [Dehalococcoidia bacterium]PKB82856.1 MAG: glutamine--tRNA ligase [SAR202 cluster bacterium MP-SInd-SRR3963457-G1]PKB84605.1 MAG: glutamine--tRNA ligase [SAR202 cluster bacterium MP-NPac-SRR3961935-G1]RUA19921.1 MAG: glutamine--tRNA ligase [Chloroflexota bacterium]RUA33095.1 MAG: glutamine--tRNA ligase [Chloroflexota bacterium]